MTEKDMWQKGPTLNETRWDGHAVVTQNRYLYVFGGENSDLGQFTSFEVLDVKVN